MIEPQYQSGAQRESLWLVALYDTEESIRELLVRLHALGVETADASIVRVELNDQLRVSNLPINQPPLAPATRSAITGAIIGSAALLLIGAGLYEAGFLKLGALEGLPAHAILFVLAGALVGALIGAFTNTGKRQPAPHPAAEKMQEIASDGYLVAIKLPPRLGEQAEAIARSLGAKQILL